MQSEKLPQEINIEQSVLVSIMIDPEHRQKAFELLTTEDFYSEAHRIIFQKCKNFSDNGKTIEPTAIFQELNEKEKQYVKASDLIGLADTVPLAVNIEEYIKKLRDAAKCRRAIELSNAIAKSAERSDSEALERLAQQLLLETKEPEADLSEKKYSGLCFPYSVMTGAGGYFANVYSEVMEAPQSFLFMGYLTGLSAVVSPKLTIRSALKTQPRLFTVLLGASATERKSTAVGVVIQLFKSVLKDNFNSCWGVGSAEGLQKILDKKDEVEQKPVGTLLAFDELKAFVSKCNIDSSVLLPIVNTLFESNIYETHTKKKDIYIDNAYLSLLAASTIATYERIYNSAFLDIGFPNRVFIVPDTAKKQFSIPPVVSSSDEQTMRDNLIEVLRHVRGGLGLDFTENAKKFYHEWYMNLEQSIHAKRLDTYSLRLMMLLAINSLKSIIDRKTVEHATALCDWQLEVRKLHDPIDAESNIAKMEEKIRRALKKGPLKDWELKRKTGANRDGLWVYDTAKRNLQKAKEIDWDKSKKQWIFIQ